MLAAATAKVVFGLYDGGNGVMMFEGEAQGTIADFPYGEEGFGWDPVFIPSGWDKTWGQMTKEEQQESSMGRIALKKLEWYLQETSSL
jgi:inosine/xanthosine triphosphate pyrophosphatase family protein